MNLRAFARIVVIFLIPISNLSCSVNALTPFADVYSSEALFYEAQSQINNGSYTAALATIAEMEDSYQSKREVKVLKASAYGGICGMKTLDFAEALTGLGTTRLFPLLLDYFRPTTAAKIDACTSAETAIKSIGAIGVRTTDENLFLALISLAKVGRILSYYMDLNQDGNATAATDPCPFARGARPGAPVDNDFYEPDLRQMAASLMQALININAISSEVSIGNAALSGMTTACTAVAFIDNDVCTKTDPTAFTATELKAVLSFVKEDTVTGLGADCSGDVTACFCP